MAKNKDKKIVAVYIGGLGGADTFTDIPARDLTEEDVKGIDKYTLDEILDLPAHSEYKLYEKPSKSNQSDKPKTEDLEVDDG